MVGTLEMHSPLFSRVWSATQDAHMVATVERLVRRRMSVARLDDGSVWYIEPHGWGTVGMLDGDREIARADRRSWLGRRWDLTGRNFAYQLWVDSMLRRRWEIGLPGAPIAELHGGTVSFNSIRVVAALQLPVEALLLSWQIIVRAWEAASSAVAPAYPGDSPEPVATIPTPEPTPEESAT